MFAHYKRTDTNVVGYISLVNFRFEWAVETKVFVCNQSRLPVFVREDEFMLLTELSPTGEATGRDAMMVVNMIIDDVVHFRLVEGDPDVFWANQQVQEQ